MKLLLIFFIFYFILFIFIENNWINAEIRTKRQGAPMFLDWTAPRRGPSPQGGNGPYGPFGVGMAGLMQGILFGGR